MRTKKILIRSLELLFITLWVFPLAWMLITSLKLEEEVITKTFTFWPQNPSLANYIKAFTSTYIINWMGNSFVVSLFAMLLTLAVDAPIAYAFAKIPFRGRNILFWLVMGGMMVPFQVLIVPLYLQFNSYGLVNTLAAAYLPRIALPIGIFILKQFYEGIPTDLEEAAFIDGANRARIFFKIIVPLGQSAMATVIILSFINAWNDFLWPLIVITDNRKQTIQQALANFVGQLQINWSDLLAMTTIAIIPVIIVFLAFQRFFFSGIAAGSVKG